MFIKNNNNIVTRAWNVDYIYVIYVFSKNVVQFIGIIMNSVGLFTK